MKRFTKLTALVAVGAVAPAIMAPALVSSAHAQAAGATGTATTGSREFQDVPLGHWAYPALQKLAAAGVLEGYPPTGNFIGQRPMTRYEFAVAIARLLDRIPGATNTTGFATTDALNALAGRVADVEKRPVPDVTRAQVNDAIDALRREFNDEITRINGRLDVVDSRLTQLEARVPARNRITTSVSILHRRGFANDIDNRPGTGGRSFLNPGGNNSTNSDGTVAVIPVGRDRTFDRRIVDRTFSYTDAEVRVQDQISDRLSALIALRSLGSTQEDPWVGDSNGGLYVREAFATASLGNRIGLKNITATLGRQHTVIGTGLLYDNQLSPTDQLHYDANLGPIALTAFFGTQNNSGIGTGFGFAGGSDPYGSQGSEFFLNPTGVGGVGGGSAVAGSLARRVIGFGTVPTATVSGLGQTPADDNETLLGAGLNLFRISGQPVRITYNTLLDGFQSQAGDSVALSVPIFNRTIGAELVSNRRLADGTSAKNAAFVGSSRYAGLVTVPVLRTSVLDLNFAYGKAGRGFEFFGASSANPYARTYGEAIFDRPVALGAPLLNPNVAAGQPQFLTAKETYDVSGKLRIPVSFLRRVPLDVRYYTARSGGGLAGDRRLGDVYSVGTTFNLTPGVNFEVKGGIYNPRGYARNINYVRIGASVGF